MEIPFALDKYKQTFETWNKMASLYQDKFMDLELYNASYDFVCNSLLNNKADLLEIGCGPGNIIKYLLSKKPQLNILGTDIAPNMLQLAKKNNPSANFEILDCRAINTLNQKFDAIICGFCLPYLAESDCKKLISDSFKLLHDNGIFYLSFVDGEPEASGLKLGSSGDAVYFYYYTYSYIQKQLTLFNFELIKLFEVDYNKNANEAEKHIVVIARKRAIQ